MWKLKPNKMTSWHFKIYYLITHTHCTLRHLPGNTWGIVRQETPSHSLHSFTLTRKCLGYCETTYSIPVLNLIIQWIVNNSAILWPQDIWRGFSLNNAFKSGILSTDNSNITQRLKKKYNTVNSQCSSSCRTEHFFPKDWPLNIPPAASKRNINFNRGNVHKFCSLIFLTVKAKKKDCLGQH